MSYTPLTALLSAYQLQPIESTNVSLTSAALTNITNVSSEEGVLHTVTLHITTALIGNCTANLEVQVDGSATQNISVFAAGLSMASSLQGMPGTGVVLLDDFKSLPVFVPFKTSLRVGLNVTVASATGNLRVSVLRSKRI